MENSKKIFNHEKKIRKDNIFKYTTLGFGIAIGIMFITLVIFIFYEAFKGFGIYGINNILFTGKFDYAGEQKSFWIPFFATMMSSLIALLIAVPIGIKVAIFIKYRLTKKHRNKIIILFQTLSGIPSVIFGLFAINSLGLFLNLFGISKNSIIASSIMLSFMILPSMVSLTSESLNSIDHNLLLNSLALGNSKTRSIYKICKKAARNGIIIAIIVSLSRSIGESMAMSIVLQSAPDDSIFQSDFFSILNSSTQSIGAFISSSMFSDSDPEKIRPLLYSFGMFMLLFSMILNATIISIVYRKKNKKKNNFVIKTSNSLSIVPSKFKSSCEKIFFKSEIELDKNNLNSIILYTKERKKNYKHPNAYQGWKLGWEIFAIVISAIFLVWISLDIIVNGFIAIGQDSEYFFSTGKNSIAQSSLNTFLIILVTLIIGFPISLFIAIYLNEYARNRKIKFTIAFFLDSLGSMPSIIFGMFGALFFIQTLGLTNTGVTGNSLIAGALTLVIVIIPVFTRMLEQNLKNVPKEIRENSFALGNSKMETIFKLIIPACLYGIVTSVVSSIGRILSETAPLYLTAGLSSSVHTSLGRPGTTLTTHIYAQIFQSSENASNIQYQCALVTLVLVFFLVFIGYVIIPNKKLIVDKIIYYKDGFKDMIKKRVTN